MRTTMRAPARLLIIPGSFAGLVLALVGPTASLQAGDPQVPATAVAPAVAVEKTLPSATIAFVKVPNAAALRDGLKQTRFGRIANDPAMRPMIDDIKAKLQDRGQPLKERLGLTLEELIELPQVAVTIALVAVEDPKIPFAALISADAGANGARMQEVMIKTTKQAEQAGDKVATEAFKGLTLHIIQPGKPAEGDMPQPVVAWTHVGTTYYLASAATVEPLKDLINHLGGRNNSLAESESYQTVSRKLGGNAPFSWYFDINQVLRLVSKAAGNRGIAQDQVDAQLQLLGLNGLKAVGGTVAMNVSDFDTVTKTYILAPQPLQGLLRIFKFPKTALKPEPWVPATIASYQTMNWDLDNMYVAINDLADMLLPGVLQNIEQNLGGPAGNLSFQKDIFGPLGNRVTILSDSKKPAAAEADTQRMLIAIPLDDAKAFQTTLNKIFALANLNPRKREFQGTTIYDFDVPEMPNAPVNAGPQGPIVLAIAKETFFVGLEPTLLEQILRPGSQALSDHPAFQTVAKVMPGETSSLSYQKPEEQARQLYEMVRGGQFQQAIEAAVGGGLVEAAVGAGVELPKLGDLIDVSKLPEFSVIAKYLTDGGGFGVSDDDGILFTQFALRRPNP